MKILRLMPVLALAALLCGCDKQTKTNTAKLEALSQQTAALQANQAKQLAAIQSQLASLTPNLDAINNTYFTKSQRDALFYHTNTLFLLLTVGQKIEGELQVADTERAAEHALAFHYHTNEIDTMFYCTARIETALTAQEKRMVNDINAEIRQMGASLSNNFNAEARQTGTNLNNGLLQLNNKLLQLNDSLLQQIKALAPDKAETAQRQQMAADMAQIKRDLEQIKARLNTISPPATKPATEPATGP